MDEALRPGKAAYILDQILEAQNQSYLLGLKLNLAQHDVEAIHTMYLEPKDRLLHVLIAFLKHVEPTPTWRVILDALRTPSVNLQELARRVERAHFPDSTPSPRQQISSKSIVSSVHHYLASIQHVHLKLKSIILMMLNCLTLARHQL